MKKDNIEAIYPLSPMQQGMLFHSLYAPKSEVYFEQLACTLHGDFVVSAWQQAWQQVITRHSILRTLFMWENLDTPLQVVRQRVDLPWTEQDWRHIASEEQHEQVQAWMRTDRAQGFDFAHAPLLRLNLIRLSEHVYHFTWSFHHILLDGWSTSTVLDEVFSCYEAIREGQTLSLPSRRPYRDYITWLRQQDLSRAEIYWRETLRGFTTPTPLNSDLTPRHAEEPAGDHHDQRLHLPESITTALQTFARQHQLTLNTLVQGAWALLLSHYSGQQDVVFGVIVSGRPTTLTGVESMIGLFINTLPLRTRIDPRQSLLPWLQSLQAGQAEARQYEYSPLVQVQAWSEIPRGQSLFESLLVFENYPVDTSLDRKSSLSARNVQAVERTNYPLTISVTPQAGMLLHVSYDGGRFTPESIRRLLGHLQTLLEGMIAHPQQRLSDIACLTTAERQQLLVDWNATTTPYPHDSSIPALFEAQVTHAPDAIALVFEEEHLTYGHLNARANQLAHSLQHLGVGPEQLVALYLERSLEMVIAMLAILKVGGAYLPLSLDDPAERLSFILQETQTAVLLTQSPLQEKLPAHTMPSLCLDRDWPTIARQSTANIPTVVQADNLAYVMYTSGSSGQPKGVSALHRGVIRLVTRTNYARLDAEQVCLQFAPNSFDAATLEIWGSLLNGARLIIAPPGLLSLSELSHLLLYHQITLLWLTAGLFQQAVEFAPEALAQVPQLLAGGDVLSPPHVQRLLQYERGQTIINGYGPTENTTFTCTYPLHAPEQVQGPLPIGRPIANTTCYLLDADLHPVPIGVIGDLYTGGAGLARGYFQDAALTAERFVPHPFSQQPGALLYKTGDLARYRPDGLIEFLGRGDQQVKLRGFRIEPGEIEAVLAQHPAVHEAAVTLRQEQSGDKRLVAYLVLHPHTSFTVSDLRRHLQSSLPSYMLPAAFVPMEALPLTLNGKLDRRALPAPDSSRPSLDQAYTAPHTPNEQLLAAIWTRVLGVQQVGIHDNFFEVGGDSILSIQIVAKATAAGLSLTPRHLFQYQTIAQLAAAIGTTSTTPTNHDQDLVLGPLPLTPIQHWFFAQQLPDPHHWNQAVFLEARQPLDPTVLAQAVQALLTHHDILRLRAQRQPAGWTLSFADPTDQTLCTHIDLSALPAASQTAALKTAANALQASLDLGTGPILRVALFDMGPQQPVRLLLVIHHLAVDIVSWSILLENLQSAYHYLSQGQPLRLPSKTTSYQHWSERLTEYAQSPEVCSHLDFWLNQPWTAVRSLPLDTVAAPSSNTEASARTLTVALSSEETQALLTEVPKAYHTHINDVLLTALVQAFARWTGRAALLLSLEGHGREDVLDGVDLSRTVGWFTTLAPLVLSIAESQEPGAALKSIKEQLRRVPQHGLSFGLLRYLSQEPTSTAQLAALPHPEVSFNYFGRPASPSAEESLFTQTTVSMGAVSSPRNQRPHVLEMNGNIAAGQLYLEWTYSNNLHHHDTIERLASFYLEALQELITHCQSPSAGGFTPSDFPAAPLTQTTLDTLVATLSEASVTGEIEQKKPNIEAIYPLSPMQEGMLFHYLYEPHSEVYFEQFACTLHSNLDVAAFQQAWQQVIARHPILRTLFRWEQLDTPLQVVRQQVALPWTALDWRHVPTSEHADRLQNFVRTDRAQGFDLSQAPLLRLSLIRLSEHVYHFTWSFHHLLLDGWSVSTLLGEVFAYYKAARQGQTLSLPASRPYSDYIAWLQQQDLAQAQAFWRETLRGFTTPTSLGIDLTASNEPESTLNYHDQIFHLSATTTTALQTLARQQQLTLNTLVQGAWALLLSHYRGQQDVVFGVIVSGRPAALAGVESMVGLFINTLPLRTQVDPQQSLLPWLHALQAGQADARQFDYTPLVQIQNWSEVPRGHALFESLLVFENYPVDASLEEESSLGVENVQAIERTNYPLTVTVAPDISMLIRVSYNGDRFTHESIHRLAGHLQTLLESMLAHPQQRLWDIPFLTTAERQHLLFDWNPSTSYAQAPSIPALFEAQVARATDAIALVFEEEQLSYGALNDRANQLAHHLQRLGVGAETLVGLCLERSLDMLVAILGVLKAGAAYVPLDPSSPPGRLAFLLADAQLSVLLTQSQLSDRVMLQHGSALCLDTDWPVMCTEPTSNLASSVNPDTLAYVIYTSGSTGQPKGVPVSHAQVTRLFAATDSSFHFNQHDRWTLFHSYAFDFSVWEIWGALLYGGRLVVVPLWQSRSPDSFAALLQTQSITVLNQTPSAFRQLSSTEEASQATADLRLVIFGGEALDPHSLQPWFERHGDRSPQLVNMYGITETTVHVTFYPLTRSDAQRAGASPIGRPLADLQVYILDTHMQPTPIGVGGEMYVGGAGLSRGYLHRSELTAERFVPHPFSQQPGARLYKTGDLVRFLPDGQLAYLGRNDSQVKIRGFRIELGEIEAALAQHPSVSEAVVVAREDQPGDKRLVAYVVARPQASWTSSDLRRHLQSSLPDYMLPAAFVSLEALPLTSNGKLDRRALPAPDSRPSLDQAYAAPQTATEQLLADIWSQVLGLPQVGIHDNFFEVGGDSILSIRIVAKATAAGLLLTPRHLFQHPSIAQLALVVGETSAVQTTQDLVLGSLPLTPIQHWFFQQALPNPHHWNQAVLLEAQQPIDPTLLGRAVQALLTHHDMLRLRALHQPSGWSLSVVEPDDQTPCTHSDLSPLPSAAQTAVLETAANALQTSLDLGTGPIMRVASFDLGPRQPGRLLLVIHHLAVDIVSWSIVLEDLQSAYQQLRQGQSVSLPPKTTSFQSWSEHLTDYAQTPAVRSQLAFWLSQPWTKVRPLPRDTAAASDSNTEASMQMITVALSAEETQALLTEVPKAYHTHINDVLLAALVQAFARWTGQTALLVDMEGHGREDVFDGVDLSRTVGWFTALAPLVLSLPDTPDPGETLKSIKEQLRHVPQHGLSFGLLRYLSQDTSILAQLAALPHPEISFNYSGRATSPSAKVEAGLFAPATESMGAFHSPQGQRPHLLDINSGIADGQLYVEWMYNQHLHRRATIEQLANNYLHALQTLIRHCQSPQSGGYTPSDFPLARLNEQKLRELSILMKKADKS